MDLILQKSHSLICKIFDDPRDSLFALQTPVWEVLDEHTPVKKKIIRGLQPPFIDKTLRKSIVKKKML